MIFRGRLLADPDEPAIPGWVRVEGGRIAEIGEGAPPDAPDAGGDDCIITPGFLDAHLHLPQITSIGCDGPDLLTWLEQVIFPAETRWQEPATAAADIGLAHRRLLASGTLGYAGYLTSHGHGISCAAQSLREHRLRAILGQSLMDRAGPQPLVNQQPQPLRRFEDARLTPSANPRFAVACTPPLLEEAAALAGDAFPIQTHLAESQRECELVAELFPDAPHYTAVYDRVGLLTPRTLLAHCVHLRDEEWRLIGERGSVVVHCPGANTFLRSGVFDLDAARSHGVRLALGSDIAAGPDIAMPRVARSMIEVAKLRAMMLGRPTHVPSPAEAWRQITRGNADALGWADAGRLEAGAAADLLILRPTFEPDEHIIGRLIYTWHDAYIAARIVDGNILR